MTEPYRTRSDDNPEASSRIEQARRQGRRITIIYGIVCAGVVSWFFGYANDRDLLKRSRSNCERVQEDRRSHARDSVYIAEAYDRDADLVLGDRSEGIPKANWDKYPYKGLADFKELVIINAKNNRDLAERNFRRAEDVRSRIEDCNKAFPNPDILPFL